MSWIFSASGRQSVTTEHMRSIARELVHRNHRAVLIVEQRAEEIAAEEPAIEVHQWPGGRPGGLASYPFLDRLIRRDGRVSGVIAQFSAINSMMLVSRLRSVPVRLAWHRTLSTQWHANWPSGRLMLRLLISRRRLSLRLATHVVANSAASRDDLTGAMGVPAEKVCLVPNAIADPLAWLDPVERDPRRVVCVGALLPAKGQETLIRAAALLAGELDFHVEFYGDGPMRPGLERLAAELGVAGRCLFAGGRSHPVVMPRVAGAAVAVVPSLSEAFGLVNVEAMAVRTPVLASRVGGIPEVVRDGVDGLLVPPGDASALAAGLRRLLADPRLRTEMGERGRERFLERFERTAAVQRQIMWLEGLQS